MSMETTADNGSGPGALARFAAWWGGELAGCLPAFVRRLFAPAPKLLHLTAESDPPQWCGHPDAGPDDIAAALRSGRAGIPVLQIAADRALIREVTLPAEARRHPAETLELEIERQTPFRREQVHYAFAPSGDEAGRLRLAVVSRALVADDLARLQNAGLAVEAVEIEDIGPLADPPLPARQPSGGDPLVRLLLVAACLLGLAAAYAPRPGLEQALQRTQETLEALRPRAEAAARRNRERDAARTHVAGILEARRTSPAGVVVLEEATRVIPDDTWIAFLSMREGMLHLEGSSSRVSDLLIALESSPLFETVDLRAPVVRDAGTNRERFQVAIGLKGSGQ